MLPSVEKISSNTILWWRLENNIVKTFIYVKKVKRKNLYGEKISRERTNEYKLGKYVKKWGRQTFIRGGGYKHSSEGVQTFMREWTDILEREGRQTFIWVRHRNLYRFFKKDIYGLTTDRRPDSQCDEDMYSLELPHLKYIKDTYIYVCCHTRAQLTISAHLIFISDDQLRPLCCIIIMWGPADRPVL